MRLKGKIALVTGGSTGIGLATAKRFVEEGAFVYITGRRQAELNAAVKELGNQVRGVQGDVSSLADLDKLFAQIKTEKGTLDIVFANAGGGSFGAIGQITEEQYDRMFDINVKGMLFTVQKALPLLKDGSSVILTSSIVSQKGMANFSVYSATKAAIRSFARTWTADLKDRKIRVNAVSPGPIVTPGASGLLSEGEDEAFYAQMAAQVPLGRVGQAKEIADAVVYLASSESSYVAGIELFVDGGMAQV